MGLLTLALCLQQATLHAEPEQVQVGQPVTWTLVVEHDVDETVLLDNLQSVADDTWVQLSGPRVARVREGEQAGTCIDWELFSLEAGDRALPSLAVSLSSGLTLVTLAGNLNVRGDLGPDEDAPRPLGGPLAAPVQATSRSFPWWYGLLLLVLPVAFLRKRAQARLPESSMPQVDLAELLAGGASPGDFGLALAGVIRRSFDEEQDVVRVAMLAEEWVGDVTSRGGIDAHWVAEAKSLLAWSASLAFAQVQPSKMALSDALERTQALLARPTGLEEVA